MQRGQWGAAGNQGDSQGEFADGSWVLLSLGGLQITGSPNALRTKILMGR